MAKAKGKNVYPAPNLVNIILFLLGKGLKLTGQPLFRLLLTLLIFLLFILSLIGALTRKAFFFAFTFLSLGVRLIKKFSLPKPRLKPPVKVGRKFVYLALLFVFFTLAFWFFILKGLPSPEELVTREKEVSTKIYDRNGTLLYKIYKDKNRTIITLDQVPEHVRLATLAAEDAEFYYHPGFSIRGILRAVVRNATRGEVTGGSTITQQLVKNALLSSEKTLVRKLREIILAVGVETAFSKDEILEMYLNEVSYGGTAYGIQEAAKYYFDKDVEDLSLAEGALLASLPKSPTKYSPFGQNPELALLRQKDVVNLMVINKFISQETADEALSDNLSFSQKRTDIKAPHFVMFVREELERTYGKELVEKGGLEVKTTLDYQIQTLAEAVIKDEVEKLKGLNVGNAALVVLEPKTGQILAMVGSKDYFDVENEGNVNVTIRPRQPGSAIKVVNYAHALSNGLSASTIIDDSPVSFSIPGQENYVPRNYDGKFRGRLSLRSAFAESRNVPAVKVLAGYGVEKMVSQGKKMGITTWDDKNRFGLSLTLGGGEVTLLDLSQVYATVANQGVKPTIRSILEVKNYQDVVLEKTDYEGKAVLDPRVAFILTDILSDNQARSPAFGSFSRLVIPGHPEVAVKTGTSNNLRDNLTIGYNQGFLVGVWVGNNDNSPMSRVASGITGASPIWNRVMTSLLAQSKPVAWSLPQGLVRRPSCSGSLEWFLEESQPAACQPQNITNLRKETKDKPWGQILEEGISTQTFP